MIIESGAKGVSTYFVLRDAAEHLPNPNLTVTNIDLYYVTHRGAISEKADCILLESPAAPWAANGAYNVGQGIYRIDWPDAAFAGEINEVVQLIVVCFGIDTTFLEVLLSTRMMTMGAGAISWIYTLTDEITGFPIADAEIWISLDNPATNIIAQGRTDQNGKAYFMLDAGIIYVWRARTGYIFDNPDQEEVT